MVLCRACHEDTQFEHDPGSGTAYCPKCGSVAEENQIVSEVTFGENSTGAAVVNGAYVGADQTRVKAPGGRRPAGAGGVESREQTIANGRRKIQQIIIALRLPDRFTDQAQRFYSLALNNNFVRGRRTNYVVSACLYIVCRMEKTSHMLIDFSDLLQVNVFILGSTYLKLVQDLNLTIPAIDPSLFISRFASLLEFGDETQQVANDATRLVQRFSRDWMHTGRRPAGICGAALILAARMNNFRRSVEEIVQVVKIADVTLKKRLEEFSETASSNLTITDFRTVDLTETADPPAFGDEKKKDSFAIAKKSNTSSKGKKVRFSRSGVLSDDEGEQEEEANEDEDEEERGATPRTTTRRSKGSMQAINAQMDQLAAEGGTGLAAEEEDGDINPAAWIDPFSGQDEEGRILRKAMATINAAEEDEDYQEEGSSQTRGSSVTPGDGFHNPADLGWNGNKMLPVDTRTAEEIAADEAESAEITNEIASELHTPHYSTISNELADKEQARWQNAQNPRHHSTASGQHDPSGLGHPAGSDESAQMGYPQEPQIDTFSDLDEDELDALILTEEEVKIKERLWMEFNKEYLANVAERHLRAELDEKPFKKKERKKRQARDSSMPSGETAAEATKNLLKQKKFSKKINYAAIDMLLGDVNDEEKAGVGGGGIFDENDDNDDAFSRSSRASSLAPSLAGSDGGHSNAANGSGSLKKRKRRASRSKDRESSLVLQQNAEKMRRRLEMKEKSDRSRKRTFSPTKGSAGNTVLQAKRNGGGNTSGDPSKSPYKRMRLSAGQPQGEEMVGGDEHGHEYEHEHDQSVAQDAEHSMNVEEQEDDEEEEEEAYRSPPPAAEEEDDMTAEFRRLRGQSGGDEYGDGDDGWD